MMLTVSHSSAGTEFRTREIAIKMNFTPFQEMVQIFNKLVCAHLEFQSGCWESSEIHRYELRKGMRKQNMLSIFGGVNMSNIEKCTLLNFL